MHTLEGKVVAVTGAAKRIGRCIALHLASRGAKIAVHYNTSKSDALATAAACGGQAFRADLANVAEIRRLFGEIETAFGRLDCLVNNAAVFHAIDPLDASERDWDAIHSVNLKAAFFCCQQAAKIMLRGGGGRIVNIASLGGLRPWAKHVPYCTSKAGVVMLTHGLAKALAPDITVNGIAPGVIHFGDQMPDEIARLVRNTPMGRHGSGEEIASAVGMLLEGPAFVTGQIIAVDGGLSLK